MTKGRVEDFIDGVMAIIITIMVLELRPPSGADLSALAPLVPKLLSYTLSFVFLGIYWNNHHHMWQAVRHVNGRVLWANLHLLFWLSLVPFVTAWMGDHFAPWPVACYGIVLILDGLSYFTLTRVLLACHAPDSTLARAVGKDFKGVISLVLYALAIPLAFVNPWWSCALFVTVAIMWLIPDPRFERLLAHES